MLGYGWLARLVHEGHVDGIPLDLSLDTRFEEYSLLSRVLKQLPPGKAWDPATGFRSDWHIAPMVMVKHGWNVLATDIDPCTVGLPTPPGIIRRVESMVRCPEPDASFDLVTCISTLEHLMGDVIQRWLKETLRVLKTGGILLITADNFDPVTWPRMLAPNFDVGERSPDPSNPLGSSRVRDFPGVSYVIARRL